MNKHFPTDSERAERMRQMRASILGYSKPVKLDALRKDWYLTPSQYDALREFMIQEAKRAH